MGCIVSSAACCFLSSAASCCCSFCPSCRSSSSSRIMFTVVLILTTILSSIALIPEFATKLAKIPALCSPFELIPTTKVAALLDCDAITGFGAVYRLCFATVMFYLPFALIMIRVKSSQDCRSKLQNGFWFFKFLIWILLVVAAFFIPVEGFTLAWMIIGMIGAVIFILVQLVLLVDFAHSWAEAWTSAYEETSNRIYVCGLLSITIGFYLLSIVGVGLLYAFYAGSPECALNQAMLSINLIICFILSIISILPKVQECVQSSGLLQSSVVTLYVVYLTWSAFSNSMDPACNPSVHLIPPSNATQPDDSPIALSLSWQVAVGVIFLTVSVIYSAIKSSSNKTADRLTLSSSEKTYTDTHTPGVSESGGNANQQVVWDDESDRVTYNYSLFHFILILSCFYVMMMLTNWFKPNNDLKSIVRNPASYWVRMSTSWTCQALYLWTMVAPILFPDRF